MKNKNNCFNFCVLQTKFLYSHNNTWHVLISLQCTFHGPILQTDPLKCNIFQENTLYFSTIYEPSMVLKNNMYSHFFKFYFIFKLYNIILVLPNIEMNPPQVYMCSPFWTLLPPPSPYHPSGSSQCTSPKHPVWCFKPGLATRFIHDIIHVSMPFSQIFPPSPSPTESIRLFYTSVSLLLSRI